MTLGEKLSMLRKKNNYTQEQLAYILEVSRQSVSKWESDITFPETDKLIRLSTQFNKTCDIQIHSPNFVTFAFSIDGYQKATVISIDENIIKIKDGESTVILNKKDVAGIVES